MKQTNLLLAIAAFVFAQMLFSCSPSTNEGFAKRKYFDYKWDKKEYAKVETQKQAPAPEAITLKNETVIAENTTATQPEELAPVTMPVEKSAPAPVRKSEKKHAASVNEDHVPVMGAKEGKTSLAEKMIVKKIERVAKKQQSQPAADINTLLLIIITILLPPLGVALVTGIDSHFWISVLLTLLFYFPGLIYSLIVVLNEK